MIDVLLSSSEWIVASAAVLGALLLLLRKAGKRIQAGYQKVNLASDTLLGRDAVRHPETGAVLVDATPNLGMRFARMEEALVRMADTHQTVSALSARVDSAIDTTTALALRVAQNAATIAALTARTDHVSVALSDHISHADAMVERLRDAGAIDKGDQDDRTAMWDAITAIARTAPLPEPGTKVVAETTISTT